MGGGNLRRVDRVATGVPGVSVHVGSAAVPLPGIRSSNASDRDYRVPGGMAVSELCSI